MRYTRWWALFLCLAPAVFGATFGSVVAPTGGYLVGGISDIVLDEGRSRLYLVNSSQQRVEIYSIAQRRFLASIRTSTFPIAAAMSRSGRFLYVTCYDANALNVLNLDTQALVRTISLPAKPEGVAVGADERVLITTIGTGTNNAANTLLLWDPNATDSNALGNVVITPPTPMPPQLPPLSGRPFLAGRSQLIATRDGDRIIGLNAPNNNARAVFVYETASGTVTRSRTVTGLSTVLSISPEGSKFMAGLTLFETETLTVLAQQNAANAQFPLSTNTTAQGLNQVAAQFNAQQNQGGSVFAPDGSALFAAFNIAPVQNPPARANISQFYIDDPDNMFIRLALQLPENAAGKMVVTSDGATVFALSESGFMILPLGQLYQSPIAASDNRIQLLANDQCGVTAPIRSQKVTVRNEGRGRMTASAILLQAPVQNLAVPGLGGAGGPGGGAPGITIPIVLQPIVGALPAGQTQQQAQVTQTAPRVQSRPSPDGSEITFDYNPMAARALGTVTPHDFLVQSAEAVNVIPSVRVFQNNRDAEARADIVPLQVAISPNEGPVDLVPDNNRQRLYISNSGMNRIEVFDMRSKALLAPIKVGQLPRSIALAPDGNTLYVGNTGGEYISVVDLDRMAEIRKIRFPPIPFNSGLGVLNPSVVAATQRGVQIVMSNGTLWKTIGDVALPRAISPLVGSSTVPAPRTMVATPNGEYALLLDGNGYALLYDSLADEFVQRRQVITPPIQGYYGPVGAGPRGNYFLVNGLVLNQSLTPTANAGSTMVTIPGRGNQTPQQFNRPVSAVAAAGATLFARFVQPVVAAANVLVSEPPAVELVDVNSGQTMRSVSTIEGPLSVQVGTQRVNMVGRTLAVDPSGTVAYALTASGLSIIPLEAVTAAERPVVNRDGVVNLASFVPGLAPGGLASVFGRNLASAAAADSTPLPTVLGGVCVTLGSRPMPLTMTSPQQINAQIPPELAAGRFAMVVRSIDRKAAAQTTQVTLTKYAPAVFVDPETKQAAIYHEDGRLVGKSAPANRDQRLAIYATGLGATKGARIVSGTPTPAAPPAVTEPVLVFFGDPKVRESQMSVEWSGLVPGSVGIYQINVYVPWYRLKGEQPVTIRVGGVDSPSNTPVRPTVSLE
ncbi:MAG: hypothetical protein HY822_10465 [Acidobacteria bacterium]|nr:hypothetical protein [Acidobacteriota bacterium]